MWNDLIWTLYLSCNLSETRKLYAKLVIAATIELLSVPLKYMEIGQVDNVSRYSLVVEQSLRKRKVASSILAIGFSFCPLPQYSNSLCETDVSDKLN